MDILNQFGINPLLLAAQVVNFLILLWILNKLLYKPILKVLYERRKKIEDSLKNVEEIEKRLLETEAEKEKVLAKTSLEAQKLMDETKKEIEIMKEEGRVQAEQIALQIIKKGGETAKAEAEKIREDLMNNFAQLVTVGMEKVAGKALKKDQKEIITSSLQEVKRSETIIEREVRNLS